MKKTTMTVKKRFHVCIFLMIFCFFIIIVTLFFSMEYQKKELNQLLAVNRSVYEVKSAATDLVKAYYNYYLQENDLNEESLDEAIKIYTKQQSIVREQILAQYYIRQIEDYMNMTDTLLEQILMGKQHIASGIVNDKYQEYKDISYTEELLDWSYEMVHLSMQQFNTWKQKEIARWENRILRVIIIFCVLTVLETVLMLRWFHRKVLNPISDVTVKAALFRSNKADSAGQERKAQDELSALSYTIDEMMQRIEGQVQELKEKNQLEKLLRESEIKAMQARINPHFMFNTLNSCAQMAYIENAEKTEHMLESVSDYFRYNLKDCNYVVTFADEIKNVQDYIEIQKMRFGNRIQFQVKYEEEAKKGNVPALVIQPLIENAIVHGIGTMMTGAVIRVLIRKRNEKIEVEVADNGAGMEEDSYSRILNMIENNENVITSDGIGLSNVYGRLYGFFQERITFTVHSEKEKGTTIHIEVPFVTGIS